MDILINLIIFLPLLFALIIYMPIFPKDDKVIRHISKFSASAVMILLAILCIFFDFSNPNYCLETSTSWINILGINVSFVCNPISMMLAILLNFIFLIVFIQSKGIIKHNSRLYYALILIIQTCTTSALFTNDFFIFYMILTALIIPVYVLLLNYTDSKKMPNSFLLFKTSSLVFFLLAFLLMYYLNFKYSGVLSSDINDINISDFSEYTKTIIITLLITGFLINFPTVPFHKHYTKAVTSSLTPVSILIAIILFDVYAFGFFKYVIQLFQGELPNYTTILILIGTINIVYSLIAILFEKNIKQIICYSGIIYSGIFITGICSLTQEGMTGAIFLLITYSLTALGLYIFNEIIFRNYGTYNKNKISQLSTKAPRLTITAIVFLLSFITMPLLPQFNASLLCFLGSFLSNDTIAPKLYTIISIITVAIMSVYLLTIYCKMFMGERNIKSGKISDIHAKPAVILLFISVLIVIAGIFPSFIIDIISNYVSNIYDMIGAY